MEGPSLIKPLLFRGGVGVVAMRKHRSRQRTCPMPVELELEIGCPLFDERNHPNPSFEKEGLKTAFVRWQ
tara:strand:- start:367 stop:576 length:210 start_codon:yes stop_codon:yes gene_type:complete